jgi:catechol 2,3-dioxygenase-like lactoylglutathione lyase family enzyme
MKKLPEDSGRLRRKYVREGASVSSVTASESICEIKEKRMGAIYKSASPYCDDAMNLPVEDVEAALPFYETLFGFRVLSRSETPHKSAVLGRDDIQIGLAENGGDPSQEGCFFLVNDAEAAFEELKARGLGRDDANFRVDQHGENSYKVFFVVAPDGLCYCLGEKL